jgi:hypothetical protein
MDGITGWWGRWNDWNARVDRVDECLLILLTGQILLVAVENEFILEAVSTEVDQ